jgi:hypothetical protein
MKTLIKLIVLAELIILLIQVGIALHYMWLAIPVAFLAGWYAKKVEDWY